MKSECDAAPIEDTYWWYQGVYALIGEWLQPLMSNRPLILDAGCGPGALARRLDASARVLGVDVEQDALAAGRRAGTTGLARAHLEALPLPDGCCDAVVSVDVVCNENCREEEALREIHRVLKPGGALLLNMPAYEWLKGPHDRAGGNRRRYTAGEVSKILGAAGFVVQRITYRNTFLFPMACARRMVQKLALGSRARLDVRPLPGWLNELLLAVLVLEAPFLKHCNLPFGLSIFAVALKPLLNSDL